MTQEEGDGGKEVRSTDLGDLAKEIKTLLAKDFSSAEKSSEIVAILKSGLVKCGKGQCTAILSTYAVCLKLCFDFTHSQFSNFTKKCLLFSDYISNLMSNGIFLELVRQDLDEVLDLLLQNDILDGSVVNQVCSLEKSFHHFFQICFN